MSKIKVSLNDQRLRVCSRPLISSGDVNTDELEVGFDYNWNFTIPVTFYATFYRTTLADSVSVPLEEVAQGIYNCVIPSEMLAEAGTFTFSVYAKNEAGDIVKTSTECRQKVVQGAYTGAAAYIDWQAFKSDLIDLLNENFAADLPESASVEEITAALEAAEISETARAELIQAINQHFDAEIPETATVTEIIEYINDIQTAAEARAVIVTAINTKFSTDIPTDATESEAIAAISEIENGAKIISIRPFKEVVLIGT